MIPVREIMTAVRFRLGDMQGAERSDFEIAEAINQAAALVWKEIAVRQLNDGVKYAVVTIDEDEWFELLPSDFFRVRKVFRIHDDPFQETGDELRYSTVGYKDDEYRIFGDKFSAAPGVYRVEYFYMPKRVSGDADALDAPLHARQTVEAAAGALMLNDIQAAAEAARLFCREQAGAENSGYADSGPVQLWGSRKLL